MGAGILKLKLLGKITELVDKDIASNSKPISVIVAFVPWVPFLIFVEGAPADSYPILSGLAFAASIGWLLFVLWRLFRHMKKELAPHHKSLGSARFWALMGGTLVAILAIGAVLTWLQSD